MDPDDLTRLLLELVRRMTSAAHDGGTDEWLRDYSILDMMIVEFTDGNLTKQDLAICEGRRTYHGETWETKGFRPAVCWRQIAIN